MSKPIITNEEFRLVIPKVINKKKSLRKKYNVAAVESCLNSGGPQVLEDALFYLDKKGKVRKHEVLGKWLSDKLML